MTCIVGWTNSKTVLIGGDSLGSNSNLDAMPRRDPKVFVSNGIAIGCTSSFRMCQILIAHLDVKCTPVDEPFEWMLKTFIPRVRALFQDHGYLEKEKERESGGFFLVGVRGRLFCVESDFQVGEPDLPYWALGCGAQYALGSLHSSGRSRRWAALHRALVTAETFSAGVRAPFHFVCSDPK